MRNYLERLNDPSVVDWASLRTPPIKEPVDVAMSVHPNLERISPVGRHDSVLDDIGDRAVVGEIRFISWRVVSPQPL
jgi:hypothetical protein